MKPFHVYRKIRELLTLDGVVQKGGRHPLESDLGVIRDAAVAVDNKSKKIAWLGEDSKLPPEFSRNASVTEVRNLIWLPAFVECHTHLLYGGKRYQDYALRAEGKTYLEIGAAGGGIRSTMRRTREMSVDALVEHGERELESFARCGVGCIEIKTGYGLTLETELAALEVIRELQAHTLLRLVPTFLGAHAIPPEFEGRADAFVDELCKTWIPEVAKRKLAQFFDVFIEKGYFSLEQGTRLCEAAKQHGLIPKIHGEQFNALGSAELSARIDAASCDHLDHVSDEGIAVLAKSATVAVLLPGASLFTGTPYPPARKLIDAGARVALSTDYNPGTCPTHNLPLMTTLACSQMKMTPAEAIAAITYNAAAALRCESEFGALAVGRTLSVAGFEGESWQELPYAFGEKAMELFTA